MADLGILVKVALNDYKEKSNKFATYDRLDPDTASLFPIIGGKF